MQNPGIGPVGVSEAQVLTTGPWGPGSPVASEVQVQELGSDGHFSSSLCGETRGDEKPRDKLG